jgi:hypothetical protein
MLDTIDQYDRNLVIIEKNFKIFNLMFAMNDELKLIVTHSDVIEETLDILFTLIDNGAKSYSYMEEARKLEFMISGTRKLRRSSTSKVSLSDSLSSEDLNTIDQVFDNQDKGYVDANVSLANEINAVKQNLYNSMPSLEKLNGASTKHDSGNIHLKAVDSILEFIITISVDSILGFWQPLLVFDYIIKVRYTKSLHNLTHLFSFDKDYTISRPRSASE